MDPTGKWSLDEWLTAFEKRLPFGRFVATLILGLVAGSSIIFFGRYIITAGVVPVITFIRTQKLPTGAGSVLEIINSVLTLVVFVIVWLVGRKLRRFVEDAQKLKQELDDANERLSKL